jgi:hypothetical protein
LDSNLRKKLVKCYIWSVDFYGAKFGYFGKYNRNIWKVLKCGAGEERKKPVGLIMFNEGVLKRM